MSDIESDHKPRDVVLAFAELLQREDYEPSGSAPYALPQSLLPFPKNVIRHAIALLLLSEKRIDRRKVLEEAYIYLDRFIPDDEFELFYSFGRSLGEGAVSDITAKESQSTPPGYGISQKVEKTIRSMRDRGDQAMEEVRALRRIMGLADDLSDLVEE
ncbi:MAG: hypothetical protein ACRENF_02315 [Thermodesulfobacteriota bacterium]